ncbi:hypothetical protein [Kitasatospora brasiliensis]|uniref:hypothetical protein n=1 Tax=Kitasatospora brasiliensis TaxID=3058040 RepID=UPI00292F799A|nr:hypothetical protein [Kitasatospora sp. K002]
MKSKLAKAALTAAAALALAGAATPAFAHTGVFGGGEFAASANGQPFLAAEGFGVAKAGDTAAGELGGVAMTSEDIMGGGAGFAHAGNVGM